MSTIAVFRTVPELSALLAAQTPPTAGATAGGDIAALVLIIGFFAGFAFLGAAFLRKKRKERIEVLTEASEEANEAHHLEERQASGELPSTIEDDLPKASELIDAERAAQKADAAQDRAKRERERVEADAAEQTADDTDEAGAAKEKLEAARAQEDAAKSAAADAKDRAKQLRMALSKTRDGFVGRLSKALGGGSIDESVLDDLESVLFTADIGARTAERLLDRVRTGLKAAELKDAAKVTEALRDEVVAIFDGVPNPPLVTEKGGPSVIMIVGVNGAGKTTTIGKLTHELQNEGNKVLLGAGDTFRAAAVEQLEIWGQRNDCPVVKGEDGADPASVLFDAVKKAREDGRGVVLCDTAGRLHTKVNLMEKLKKVHRVLGKAADGAPHEVLLVLDATVGQNAIAQAKQFGEAVPLTGIVLTKLDGTAKGGVVIGIADELGLPVRYIGVGEKIGDLRRFNAAEFVDALFNDGTDLRTAA